MTHFVVIVLLPPGEKVLQDEAIAQLLAKYDEGLKVEPYPEHCSCGELEVSFNASNYAKEKLGKDVKELRDEFHAKYPDPKERTDELWQAWIKPFVDLEEEFKKTAKVEPQADCSDCHGSGTYQTTYNPQSKWDWYKVGGRWTGILPDNQCVAKDFMVLWPAGLRCEYNREQRRHEEEVREAAIFNKQRPCELYEFRSYIPGHLVTPDGVWHAEHKNGWWGTVTEKYMDEGQWKVLFEEQLGRYADHIAVVVDCHI